MRSCCCCRLDHDTIEDVVFFFLITTIQFVGDVAVAAAAETGARTDVVCVDEGWPSSSSKPRCSWVELADSKNAPDGNDAGRIAKHTKEEDVDTEVSAVQRN